jgi:4-hydroxyphenylpyruvate dioxygenase
VKALGMQIACTQPLRKIEGIRDPDERRATLDLVAKRFPFMRAFDTDLVFMCSNIQADSGVTSDLQTVSRDLAELGDVAAAYSRRDGGRMLKIGYEGLSWAVQHTWSSSWEVVRAANRPNVGLIVDSFNLLAVEFANPYNPAGHGRIYPTMAESMAVLGSSLAAFVATVPGDRIFFVQLGDAELVDPSVFCRRRILRYRDCCLGRESTDSIPWRVRGEGICLSSLLRRRCWLRVIRGHCRLPHLIRRCQRITQSGDILGYRIWCRL